MKTHISTLRISLLFLMVFSFSNCKKEFFDQHGDAQPRTLNGSNPFSVHVEFNAVETVFKKYRDPVDDSPKKRHKLLASYQQEQSFNFSLDASQQGVRYEIDKIETSTPVEEWNKPDEGRPFRIINDGSHISIFDRNAKLIHKASADASGITTQKIIAGLATAIDMRPIEVKIQELQALGAEVQQDAGIYMVITRSNNPNFRKNSLSVYSALTGKLFTICEYDDVDDNKLKSFRLLKYNDSGFPIEIYTEEYTELSDGDLETAVTILDLRNPEFTIN